MLCNWTDDLFVSLSLDPFISESFANGLKVGAGGGGGGGRAGGGGGGGINGVGGAGASRL